MSNLSQEESLRVAKEVLARFPSRAVDNTYGLVKNVLKLRESEYKKSETKKEHEREKQVVSELLERIFSVYKDEEKNAKVEEIIGLIDKHFNLVDDDGEFVMYTPKSIFEILKGYIDIDFEKNFRKIAEVFVNQYSQKWEKDGKKTIYNGYELMGGVLVVSGDHYKAQDRHFIKFTLKPALEKYYERDKEKCWSFVKRQCIVRKVSRDHPDFLNRAAIPILLERYKSANEIISQEAFQILEGFVLSCKGIPSKSDLIYEELRGDFSDSKKWRLVQVSINKYKIPVNSFVEEIVLKLATHGHKRAMKLLKDWIGNEGYYESGKLFGTNVVVNISRILDYSFEEGLEMFKDFIGVDYFLRKMESFDAFSVARLLNKIINRDVGIGVRLLKNLSHKPVLTGNEQILLCNGLIGEDDSKKGNEEVLVTVYEEFLNPFLVSLDNSPKKIEKIITRSQSREAIVRFGDALVKNQRIPETLRIAKVFIDDSDPCTPKRENPEDPEGKYDEHKRIERGEETHAITTVRGWCAWVLMDCAVLAGRDHIKEIIDLTEKLTKDDNYYIQSMSCFPLRRLARNRLTVMPENKEELFLDRDKEEALRTAKRIEKIAFDSLRRLSKLEPKPRDVLIKALLKVFHHIRALNQENALELVQTIIECGEEAIANAASLFIYFAELRNKDFKDWKWRIPGLYDDLDDFDNKIFQQLLKDILKKGNPKINSEFASCFGEFVQKYIPEKSRMEKGLKYSEAFEISCRYLSIISDYYDERTFKHIHQFVEHNLGKRPQECYQLWRKCLDREKRKIAEESVKSKSVESKEISKTYWWPYYENKEILIKVKENVGIGEFLDSLEFLLGYPKDVYLGDISGVAEILQSLSGKYIPQIEKIFDKLIARNIALYDAKETWKKKIMRE